MVVGLGAAGCVGKLTLQTARDGKPPGHAEVHDKHFPGREMRGQELGLPGQPVDPGAFQPFGEPVGQGKAQVRPALLGAQDAPALHHGGKAAANCLDFG